MSNTSRTFWTAADLATRWNVHRASVPRILARFGCSGIKFAPSQQAGRRFSTSDVELVEKLAGQNLRSRG